MKTAQWIKKLGGRAGELYVAAELSKREIPNALLPENFSEDDIIVGKKDGSKMCFVQVKSCHPDRSQSFRLDEKHEQWRGAPRNQYVVFVWLGSVKKPEGPRYWIAPKRDVGAACVKRRPPNKKNRERRFWEKHLDPKWQDNWAAFDEFAGE